MIKKMIGVLSLQGDFAEHISALVHAGAEVCEVRTIADLSRCSALVMPGGESTTIGKLLKLTELDKEICSRFKAGNLKVWGTCAGAILCASKIVSDNPVNQLNLGDYSIARNAYGSQLDSFETMLDFADGIEVEAAFIRAPKILEFGSEFEVLASNNGPVFIKNGNLLVSTCHPELYENNGFYEWLISWFC